MSRSKVGAFSSERLKYYFQELNGMENAGRKVSFTDLWGLIVEYFLHQKVRNYIRWEHTTLYLLNSFSDVHDSDMNKHGSSS